MVDLSKEDITFIGKLLIIFGCVQLYYVKNSFGNSQLNFYFKKYHPLSWITYIITYPLCWLYSENINDVVTFSISKAVLSEAGYEIIYIDYKNITFW